MSTKFGASLKNERVVGVSRADCTERLAAGAEHQVQVIKERGISAAAPVTAIDEPEEPVPATVIEALEYLQCIRIEILACFALDFEHRDRFGKIRVRR